MNAWDIRSIYTKIPSISYEIEGMPLDTKDARSYIKYSLACLNSSGSKSTL